MMRSVNPSIKGNLLFAVLCLGLQIPFGIIVSHYYLLDQNTLANNGAWLSSKRNLGTSVMGARSFTEQPHALAKNRLNLAAWHGFQEVIYKDSLHLKQVEFDFLLGPSAYLNFIFNKCVIPAQAGSFRHVQLYSGLKIQAVADSSFCH